MYFKLIVMYILLVLVFLAAVSKISATNLRKRMIDGTACDIKGHPSVVSITNASYSNETDTGYTYKYGTGVLITLKWVLTYKDVFEKDDYTGYKVLAGSSHELAGSTDEVRDIVQLVSSPFAKKPRSYTGWGWRYWFLSDDKIKDVTLAKLDKPFKKTDKVQPANLPPYVNWVDSCKQVTIVLWGQRETLDNMIKKLVVVQNEDKLGDSLDCGKAKLLDEHSCYDSPEKLCFKFEGRTRICENDMGAGIFCNDTLVGSTTNDASAFCTGETGEAYNISRYMTWLHDTTDVKIPPNFYDVVIDGGKPKKRRTTENPERSGSTHSTTSDEGYDTSNGHRMKTSLPIYVLLICLRFIL